jgi:SagB-type dehydrogenase family enzyme
VSPVGGRQTARWLEFVYGRAPEIDDPAEAYHEASKVAPTQIGRQLEGTRRLAASPELLLSSVRAVKRHGGSRIPLPAPASLDQPLGEAIMRRRSRRVFADGPIARDVLAALLQAGYGVTRVWVDDLEPGLYHFDPLWPGLEVLRSSLAADELATLSTYPEIASSCSVVIFVAAIFGRARFKYGLRGYRFALLEAGHVAQNVTLAAASLGLAAVPLGAFYDRRTDTFLGLDGVNESTVYAIALGPEPE